MLYKALVKENTKTAKLLEIDEAPNSVYIFLHDTKPFQKPINNKINPLKSMRSPSLFMMKIHLST